jgi:hypothetical protein
MKVLNHARKTQATSVHKILHFSTIIPHNSTLDGIRNMKNDVTWQTLYYICSHLQGILQSKYLKLIYNKTYHLLYPNTTTKKKWKSWKKNRVRINKKLLCKFEIFTVVWGFWFSGMSCRVTGQVVSIIVKERNVSIFYNSSSSKKQHSITSQKTGI